MLRACFSTHGSWALKRDYISQSNLKRRRKIALHSVCTHWQTGNEEGGYFQVVLLLRKRFTWNHMFLGFPWWELICLPLPLASCVFFPMGLLKERLISKMPKFLKKKIILACLPLLDVGVQYATVYIGFFKDICQTWLSCPCSRGLTSFYFIPTMWVWLDQYKESIEPKNWSIPWFLSMMFLLAFELGS